MSKSYIPSNDGEYNDFQEALVGEVNANATAWGIDAADVTELNQWSSDYAPIYKAIKNKEKRTPEQVMAHREFRKLYDPFLRGFCQSFLTNNKRIPISERKAMGLNPRGANAPSERKKITTAPIVSLQSLGGGMLKFGFKVAASNKRTGKHPESNGVMVYYRLLSSKDPIPAPPVVLPVGPEPPAPDDGDSSSKPSGLPTTDGFMPVFSPRASFTRQLQLEDIGKILHVYAQWVNTSDAAKNGPFSMVATVVVS